MKTWNQHTFAYLTSSTLSGVSAEEQAQVVSKMVGRLVSLNAIYRKRSYHGLKPVPKVVIPQNDNVAEPFLSEFLRGDGRYQEGELLIGT